MPSLKDLIEEYKNKNEYTDEELAKELGINELELAKLENIDKLSDLKDKSLADKMINSLFEDKLKKVSGVQNISRDSSTMNVNFHVTNFNYYCSTPPEDKKKQ